MNEPNATTAVSPSAEEFGDSFFAPAWADVPIDFGAASHAGNVRPQNEDHFAIFRQRRTTEVLLSSLTPEDTELAETCSYAIVVADGMGGMRSGEYASRLAIQTVLELSSQASSWAMKFTDLDAQQIRKRVESYVQRIHAALREEGQADLAKADMGTTWTSAHILGQYAVVVHLGDSRAYVFRDGRLVQLTRDETMAQTLVDAGMKPEEVGGFNHVLINSFGGGVEKAIATIDHLKLQSKDRLLLCTDGLTDMVPDEDIRSELSLHADPQQACDALVNRALDNGGKDNVTIALASIGVVPS